MKRPRNTLNDILRDILPKALLAAPLCGLSPAFAQSFQTYHCTDGTQFVVGFYRYDPRAYLQIDGRQITLSRRLAISGTRYSAGDVTLKISRTGATSIRHAQAARGCVRAVLNEKGRNVVVSASLISRCPDPGADGFQNMRRASLLP